MSTSVNAKKREVGPGSSPLSTLRSTGYVPAVVYGYKVASTPIAVNTKELEKTLRVEGRNAVISLSVEGQDVNAVLTEVQKDPVKGSLIHLDFLAVNMSKKLEVEVPVVTIGDSVGVKEGGVLQQPNRELKLNVKPSQIPEHIEVDISSLAVGDTLAVEHIRETVDYEILNEDDFVLVTISAPVKAEDLEPDLEAKEPDADNGEVDNEEKDV